MAMLTTLKKEHRTLESLMTQLEKRPNEDKAQHLLEQLHDLLTAHMAYEESVIYRFCGEQRETEDLVQSARQGHEALARTLSALRQTPYSSDGWDTLLYQLHEALEQHVEAEEGELFPIVAHLLPKNQLAALAQAFVQQEALPEKARLKAKVSPKPTA